MQLAFCHDVADPGRDKDDDGKHGLNVHPSRERVNLYRMESHTPQ